MLSSQYSYFISIYDLLEVRDLREGKKKGASDNGTTRDYGPCVVR